MSRIIPFEYPKLWLAALAATLLLVYLLGPILTPFVLAAGLAYLGDPLVDRLQTWRLSRTAGVLVVFTVLTLGTALFLLLMFPLLEGQISTLVEKWPRYMQWLQDNVLPQVSALLPEGFALDLESARKVLSENFSSAGGLAGTLAGYVSASGLALLALLANLVLIPVVTFYLLRDWDNLVGYIRELIPRRYVGTVTDLAVETDEVLSEFVRGQLLVMLALGTIYSIGLWIVGLDLALIIGIIAGLVSFVPYLGVIVGFLLASLAALVQTGDPYILLWVGAVFAVGQSLEGYLLQPWLVGERIGLHPVTVIFAILAGGQLFGFVGVLLALPTAAVLAVLARFARREWLQSRVYQQGDEQDQDQQQ